MVKRGLRLLNGRGQILLQDDISTNQGPIEWRMHTTAGVQLNGTTASLTQNNQTMNVLLINPPNGAAFSVSDAARRPTDPPLPPGAIDQTNTGVVVLRILLPAGAYNLQVLFNPQPLGATVTDYVTPAFVPLDNWSLSSHG